MFLGVSGNLSGVDEDYDREEFARRIAEAVRTRFKGSKKAAYTEAGVNSGTFERALHGQTLRGDTYLAIESILTPVSGTRQASYVAAGEPVRDPGADDRVAAALESMAEAIREMNAKLDRIEDRRP